MSDPNEKRKQAILARAKHSGNHKVQRYLEEGLFEKLDHLGPHGGIFLEGLEADFEKFAKPEGLLHGFTAKDFGDLFKALFGYTQEL